MATPTVYVICNSNCKYESMTKEQIIAAITQAVNEGTIGNVDTGFVQTIKTVNNRGIKLFVGTQAEYNALSDSEKVNDLFAIITDDVTSADFEIMIEAAYKDLHELEQKLNKILDGTFIVGRATNAQNDVNGNAIDNTYSAFLKQTLYSYFNSEANVYDFPLGTMLIYGGTELKKIGDQSNDLKLTTSYDYAIDGQDGAAEGITMLGTWVALGEISKEETEYITFRRLLIQRIA